MRLANVRGRATVVGSDIVDVADGGERRGVDVARASDGRFPAELPALYREWDAFAGWAGVVDPTGGDVAVTAADLGPPSPAPDQIFAVGLNYASHVDEMARHQVRERAAVPAVFTKFVSCLAGPAATVTLPEGNVDWEVELVVVVGREARRVPAEEAWGVVAGVAVGQDLSERRLQMAATPPQFSLAKSHPAFGPVGPALVTPDELADAGLDRDDLAIGCAVDGVPVQGSRTSLMLFDVPAVIAHLASVVTLHPGDVIFTGTPGGVGQGMDPPRFLQAGEVVDSEIEGVGRLRNRMAAPA